MSIEIIERQSHSKGILFTVKTAGRIVKILYLTHAIERIRKWGLNEEKVAEALLLSEEVLTGHRNRFIAHRRYDEHVVRAVYEYKEGLPVLVTVYFPYSERYFKGGGVYEDKILGGG